jgi:hypothetical protein
LVWIFSTRHSASSRSGHGASVFTNDLLIFQSLRRELAGSLRHVAGFPDLGLLRTLRPAPGSSADDVPCRHRPGWPAGRRSEGGSHVHHRPFDGMGAQLFPCRPVHGYPAALHRGPRHHRGAEAVPPGCKEVQRTAIPAHIHQVRAGLLLEGVPPLVSALVHLSVSLAGPGPSGSAGPSRRCQGCSHPSPRPRGQAASSFSGLLRQATGGSLHPTRSYGASWRTQP